MKPNKAKTVVNPKPKVTKKININEILVNPTDEELLAQTLEIMKTPSYVVDPNKTLEERMKDLNFL
nr:MAG TPA: hypothetical protein [Caudoviricetes sp.]